MLWHSNLPWNCVSIGRHLDRPKVVPAFLAERAVFIASLAQAPIQFASKGNCSPLLSLSSFVDVKGSYESRADILHSAQRRPGAEPFLQTSTDRAP